MRPRAAIDISRLTPFSFGVESTLWWAMIGLIMIETTVFSDLISSYLYLRAHSPEWPPAGFQPPDLLLPTIGTLVIMASSVLVYWADSGIKKGDQRRLSIGMLGGSLLGMVFLVLKAIEYSSVPYRWDTGVYGSIVWTIIGFHSAHVIALLLKTLVVDTMAWRGYFTTFRRIGVTINGLYWHFVVAVWIPLYIVLYWVPRL